MQHANVTITKHFSSNQLGCCKLALVHCTFTVYAGNYLLVVLSQSVLLEVLGGQCTAPGSECVRVVRVALATFNNEQLVTRGVPDIGPSCSSRSYY